MITALRVSSPSSDSQLSKVFLYVILPRFSGHPCKRRPSRLWRYDFFTPLPSGIRSKWSSHLMRALLISAVLASCTVGIFQCWHASTSRLAHIYDGVSSWSYMYYRPRHNFFGNPESFINRTWPHYTIRDFLLLSSYLCDAPIIIHRTFISATSSFRISLSCGITFHSIFSNPLECIIFGELAAQLFK